MKSQNIFDQLKKYKTKLVESSKKVLFTQKPKENSKDQEMKDEMELKNEILYKQTVYPDSKLSSNFNIDKNRESQNEPGTQSRFSDIDRESESNMLANQMQSTQADENLDDMKKNDSEKRKN